MTFVDLNGAMVIEPQGSPRVRVLRGRRSLARHESERPATPISNGRIAMVMLLVAETMFFAGLIGAYLVFRYGTAVWPPPNLPSLPIGVTWANTLVLSMSGITMLGALAAARRGDSRLQRILAVTLVLGVAFLVVQGSEWVRLLHHGLTLSTGTYASTFYTLIGAHAVHVVAGVVWVGVVWALARRGRFAGDGGEAVELCTIYWSFVCLLWLVLFALVYR
jgi:heme/copper-type cytochrome/quinol oxidase subunit 3